MIVFERKLSGVLALGALAPALEKAGQTKSYTGHNKAKCQVFSSETLPEATVRKFIPIDPTSKKDADTLAGYNFDCECFRWGYRPAFPQLLGVGRIANDDGSGIRGRWNICLNCSTSGYPKPTCPTCPKCPECDTKAGLAPSGDADEGLLSKYGITPGLLVAAAMVGGVGYYGYKKGWFKRKGRR